MQGFRKGFTLVELLIVIIVVAVLAAMAIPKVANGWQRSSESYLRDNLGLYRRAIEQFHTDTDVYPATLSALTATTAPATGLDANGNTVTIKASSFRGPYLVRRAVPALHPYYRSVGRTYVLTNPHVGVIYYNTSIKDSNGNQLRSW